MSEDCEDSNAIVEQASSDGIDAEWLQSSATVTWLLITANVVMFCVMVANGVSFTSPGPATLFEWGANFPPATANGQWWRLLTCMFLHFGFAHLAVNMMGLWYLGRTVEKLVGKAGFAITYIVSGIAGEFATLAWSPIGMSAGASAALFGTAGTLIGFVLLRRDLLQNVAMKQLLKNLTMALIADFTVGPIVFRMNNAAHATGLFCGFVCGLILSQHLSPAMIPRRKIRNLTTVVVAMIVLPVIAMTLPEALPNVPGELQQRNAVQRKAYGTIDSLAELSKTGQLNDAEYAKRIEEDVLPMWIESKSRIERLLNVEYADRNYIQRVVRYMQCRQESWQLLAQGLREQNEGKIEQSEKLTYEANKMGAEQRRETSGKQ
mgnify:CR=1 FL=1